jgi:phage-related protein
MASKFNPGRNIGRVSIRVLPDTRDFNKILRRQLEDFAKKFRGEITVDKVKLDREAIRRDMQQQLHMVNLDAHDFNATVTITKAKLKKTELRKSIQEEFDKWDTVRVNIAAHLRNPEEFKRQVERVVDEASRNGVNIVANAQTMAAAAQLRYTARDRIVQFVAHANEAALAKTATALAALGGARLAGDWIEDLWDFTRNLDRSLPSILGWTSGITTAFGAVTALTGGLVGLGGGLFSITPGLLVLPGLLINAIGSLSTLIVAWKDAGEQLAPLSGGMRELGEIINTTYWDRARKPILDLVNGLLPQMKTAFGDLSEGVGDFTAALADAFGAELAEGRFESIFKGIADGWRVLAEGADGFAGAIVSLSQVAAKYTPRLARWFVRQADAFDGWLEDVSEDGRLDAWIEGSIDSLYDLWDATTGLAGVFQGLWRAADAAGAGGLAGFADMMQEWERIVQGADFQRGLTAVFRGSQTAMGAFGDGISAVGRLFVDMDREMEGFIAASGQFVGGLVEAVAEALNNVHVSVGLTEFSSGLLNALDRIKPSLEPLAESFGDLLGLLGTLAETVLPTAVGALAAFTPALDSLAGSIGDVAPKLTGAVDSFVRDMAPPINDLVAALGPSVTSIFSTLATALEDIGPKMADLAEGLSPALVAAMDGLAGAIKPLSELATGLWEIPATAGKAMQDWSWLWDDKKLKEVSDEIIGEGGWTGDLFKWAQDWDAFWFDAGSKSGDNYIDGLLMGVDKGDTKGMVSKLTSNLSTEWTLSGPTAGADMWSKIVGSDLPQAVKDQVRANLLAMGIDIGTSGDTLGQGFVGGFGQGIGTAVPGMSSEAAAKLKGGIHASTSDAGSWLNGRGGETMGGFKAGADGGVPGVGNLFGGLGTGLSNRMSGASGWLSGRGGETVGGFKAGAEGGIPGVRGVFDRLPGTATGAIPNPWGLLWGAGSSIMGGFKAGLESAYTGVKTFIGGIAGWIRDNKGPESYDRVLLEPAGQWIMGGLERGLERGFGRVKSRVAVMADEIRNEFGSGVSTDVALGVSAQVERSVAASKAHAVESAKRTTESGTGATAAPLTLSDESIDRLAERLARTLTASLRVQARQGAMLNG